MISGKKPRDNGAFNEGKNNIYFIQTPNFLNLLSLKNVYGLKQNLEFAIYTKKSPLLVVFSFLKKKVSRVYFILFFFSFLKRFAFHKNLVNILAEHREPKK